MSLHLASVCTDCAQPFEVTPRERSFLAEQDLPLPGSCPSCATQRLLAWRNERAMHRRECAQCGMQMISMFGPDRSAQVYCEACWWADSFDPRVYGRPYDFARPFFEQFEELLHTVPLPRMIIGNSENSDYTNYAWQNKDSYLLSSSDYNDGCCYSTYLFRSRSCCDCLFVSDSELVCDSIDCKQCHGSSGLQNCQGCSNCTFCFDCRSCEECIGCAGLRRKRFCIFNEQLTEAEYRRRKPELLEVTAADKVWKRFRELALHIPRKYADIEMSEGCTGDHLLSGKDLHRCFDMVESEDCSNTALGLKAMSCFHCVG